MCIIRSGVPGLEFCFFTHSASCSESSESTVAHQVHDSNLIILLRFHTDPRTMNVLQRHVDDKLRFAGFVFGKIR